jgi:hypothetical protein
MMWSQVSLLADERSGSTRRLKTQPVEPRSPRSTRLTRQARRRVGWTLVEYGLKLAIAR